MTEPAASASSVDVMTFAHKKAFKLIKISRRTMPIFQPPARTQPSPDSFGSLGKLPVEIINTILDELDMVTLTRVAKVSHGAREVVKSYAPFVSLVKHAPTALVALRDSYLLPEHKAATLYRALRSDECVSCGHYGAFLFIITGERTCFACMTCHTKMRAIFRDYFHAKAVLTERDTMRLKRARYPQPPTQTGVVLKPVELFCMADGLRAARNRYRVKPGMPALQFLNEHRQYASNPSNRCHLSLDRLSLDPLRTPGLYVPIPQTRPDLVSILLPTLDANGNITNGYWCRGCQRLLTKLNARTASQYIAYVPCDIWQRYLLLAKRLEWLQDYVARMADRAYSASAFRDHAVQCEGVQMLMGRTIADWTVWYPDEASS